MQEYGSGYFLVIEKDSAENWFMLRNREYNNVTTMLQLYKTNSAFEVQWVKDIGYYSDEAYYMSILPDNEGGCFYSYTLHDSVLTDGDTQADYQLGRFSSDGTQIWSRVVGSNGYDLGFSTIAKKQDGSLLFLASLGQSDGTFNNPGVFHTDAMGYDMERIVLAEFDPSSGILNHYFAPYDSLQGNLSSSNGLIYPLMDNSYVLIKVNRPYPIDWTFEDLPPAATYCDGGSNIIYQHFSANHQLIESFCLPEMGASWESGIFATPSRIIRVGDELRWIVKYDLENNGYQDQIVHLQLASGEVEVINLPSDDLIDFPNLLLDNDYIIAMGQNVPMFNPENIDFVEVYGMDCQPSYHYRYHHYPVSMLYQHSEKLFFFNALGYLNDSLYGGCLDLFYLDNSVSGMVFFDSNLNGVRDSNEFGINAFPIIVESAGSLPEVIQTTITGSYYKPLQAGIFSLTPVFPDWLNCVPVGTTIDIDDNYIPTNNINFALQPAFDRNDLKITILSGELNPGFDFTLTCIVANVGTVSLSGDFSLQLSQSGLELFQYNYPAEQSANLITVNTGLLNPFETKNIQLKFHVEPPPTFTLGDSVTFIAQLNLIEDANSIDNSIELSQPVLLSYDPNDIRNLDGGVIDYFEWSSLTPQRYLIRFENTGNHPTTFVRVRDTLNNNYDFSTLKILATSHPMIYLTGHNGALEFYFEELNLLPANQSPDSSQGWIYYEVSPNASIPHGTIIENRAFIYFDFNPPILTNTDTTIVDLTLDNGKMVSEGTGLKIYPNPANDYIHVTFEKLVSQESVLNMIGLDGKLVQMVKVAANSNSIDFSTSDMRPGFYFVELISQNRSNSSICKLVITH